VHFAIRLLIIVTGNIPASAGGLCTFHFSNVHEIWRNYHGAQKSM